MRKSGRGAMFKDGYEGPREGAAAMPLDRRAVPEEGAMAALEQRIHRAMLTMGKLAGDGPYSNGTFWPAYVVEFADRVDQEKERDAPRPRFRPTGADVDDMLPALSLLEGLRVEYFQLVRYKAHDDFHLDGGAVWTDLGEAFGRSDNWARESYSRAMTQAARRAGLIFTVPESAEQHAVVSITVLLDGVFVTWLGASAAPRQKLYEMRANNPAAIVDAFALWTPNRVVAKMVLDQTKAHHLAARKHGGWHWINPFDIEATVLEKAEAHRAPWRMEYLTGEPLEAPMRLVIDEPASDAMMVGEAG